VYLRDPDNGIRVYADRPRASWQRVGRELMMATDPLDIRGLLREAGATTWDGIPAGTVMGHVHLHVGDIAGAAAFFSEALGFDRTVWEYPGALFLAANGYHHNLGTNTWAGRGATPPTPDEAQLLEWTIELPDRASLGDASASLERAGSHLSPEGADVMRDPRGAAETRLSDETPRRADTPLHKRAPFAQHADVPCDAKMRVPGHRPAHAVDTVREWIEASQHREGGGQSLQRVQRSGEEPQRHDEEVHHHLKARHLFQAGSDRRSERRKDECDQGNEEECRRHGHHVRRTESRNQRHDEDEESLQHRDRAPPSVRPIMI
jgi:hypothetical protein